MSGDDSPDPANGPDAGAERDLTKDPAELAAAEQRTVATQQADFEAAGVGVRSEAHEIATLREKTRSRIAYALMALLAGTIGTAISLAVLDVFYDTEDVLSTFIQGVFTPVVALTGTALGFYFAGRDAGRGGSS